MSNVNINNTLLDTNMIASSSQVTIAFPGYDVGSLLSNNRKMLKEPTMLTPLCLVCTIVMKYLNRAVEDKTNQVRIFLLRQGNFC